MDCRNRVGTIKDNLTKRSIGYLGNVQYPQPIFLPDHFVQDSQTVVQIVRHFKAKSLKAYFKPFSFLYLAIKQIGRGIFAEFITVQ